MISSLLLPNSKPNNFNRSIFQMSNFYTSSQAMFRLTEKTTAWVSQMAASGKSKDLPVTIGLAMTACAMATLPGGNIDSPEEFFLTNAGVAAADAVDIINELMPVDYKFAMTLAKDLYLVRYELAMRPFQALGYDFDKGLATIFGLNAHIPANVLECIRHSARDIINSFEHFNRIVESIRKE